MKNFLKKSFGWLAARSATLAVGVFSIVGMYTTITTSLWICATTFLLAVAYEDQVNETGIMSALRKFFDEDFLKKQLAKDVLAKKREKFLEKLNFLNVEQKKVELELNYINRKIASEAYEDKIRLLAKLKNIKQKKAQYQFFVSYEKQRKYIAKLNAIAHLTKTQKEDLKKANERLARMEYFFFRQAEFKNQETAMEKSAAALLSKDEKIQLLASANRKNNLIKLSWLFTIGTGVLYFFSTLGSMQDALAAFTFFQFIPGAVIITVCALAAIGATLLLYHTISDLIQEWGNSPVKFYHRQANENWAWYGVRMSATLVATALGLLSVLATAGTWTSSAPLGARILNLSETLTNIVINVTYGLMFLPSLIFNVVNSYGTIIDFFQSSDRFTKTKERIKNAWRSEGPFRFFNLFRLVETIFSSIAHGLLFLGHMISMGLTADRYQFFNWPDSITAGLVTIADAITDANFLPGENNKHNHHSALLRLLTLPVTIIQTTLKVAAIIFWDFWITLSFAASWNHIFGKPWQGFSQLFKKPVSPDPKKPTHSDAWKQQEVIIVCDEIRRKLPNTVKDKAAESIANKVKQLPSSTNTPINTRQILSQEYEALSKHRIGFFGKTESQDKMAHALDHCYPALNCTS